ncbi:MAG: Holliday junction resolvase RuvX [Thermoflexales bacterium]|nr:Holliday junction resolvase RuvX [Thermoflexales bacterium]MDW8351570.1 Holliday junction resolvase RuvX [Anaerolineae bacterium]
MARTLALDVGDRRIGVAVSDTTKLIARPLCMIDRKREDAIARVVALVAEYAADEVVVGLPLHADGRLSAQAQQVQAFVEVLSTHLQMPIRWVDERYTTQDAKQILAEVRRRRQPDHDDAIAAAVILQRYLDESKAQ